MSKLRVHNLSVSIDGYVAGPDQSLDNPLGTGGQQLHEWAFATRTFRKAFGEPDGDEGTDDTFAARGDVGIHDALEQAFAAAGPDDVRVGGGASTVQLYLRAGLIDEMHLAITPILLGSGERLFENLDGGPAGYTCVELVSSPSTVHATFSRRSNT